MLLQLLLTNIKYLAYKLKYLFTILFIITYLYYYLTSPTSSSIMAASRISLSKGVSKIIKTESAGELLTMGKSYISEESDGKLTPAGWSTNGPNGSGPFTFSPGKNLIEGWSIGALSMRVGERSMIYVPSNLGYGSSPQGQKGKGWYIPANSNLCFDLEITKQA